MSGFVGRPLFRSLDTSSGFVWTREGCRGEMTPWFCLGHLGSESRGGLFDSLKQTEDLQVGFNLKYKDLHETF